MSTATPGSSRGATSTATAATEGGTSTPAICSLRTARSCQQWAACTICCDPARPDSRYNFKIILELDWRKPTLLTAILLCPGSLQDIKRSISIGSENKVMKSPRDLKRRRRGGRTKNPAGTGTITSGTSSMTTWTSRNYVGMREHGDG